MYCNQCGSQYADGNAFCPVCGTPAQPQPQPQVQQPQQPYYTQPQPQQPYGYNPQPGYNPQQPYGYNPQPVPQQTPGKGMAIASLVLGIVSFLCFAIITGSLGIVFGCVAKSKGYRGGMATAGIICGAIGIVLWAISLIFLDGFMYNYYY